MAKRPVLSILGMEKLLKRNGAHRVSEGGAEALREALETYADELSRKAIKFSEHAKRRTVLAEDVELAQK